MSLHQNRVTDSVREKSCIYDPYQVDVRSIRLIPSTLATMTGNGLTEASGPSTGYMLTVVLYPGRHAADRAKGPKIHNRIAFPPPPSSLRGAPALVTCSAQQRKPATPTDGSRQVDWPASTRRSDVLTC
jgi:hypothetical protein